METISRRIILLVTRPEDSYSVSFLWNSGLNKVRRVRDGRE